MKLLEYSAHGYDAANRETTITHWAYAPSSSGGGGTTAPLATYVYSYDQANRVTSEQDAEGTANFSYDSANELTTVTGSRTESYSYDLNGNRNSIGYTTGTENELTAAPGYTYTYDGAGNLVSQTNTSTHVTTTYTYDYHNRLTNVTVGGTVLATYTYDALGRRIGIDDNGSQTWTVYDGTSADAQPYADFSVGSSGGSILSQRYLSGPGVIDGAVVDQLLARTSASGSTAWYLPDKLGSVRDIVSSLGTVLDHVVYDSFGNIVTETNAANGDRFKYAGMEYDSVTGQYYDRARYYDEAIGRFVAQDPIGFAGGTEDLCEYVGNDPINETDPSGLAPPLPIQNLIRIEKGMNRGKAELATQAWAQVARFVFALEKNNEYWETTQRNAAILGGIQNALNFVEGAHGLSDTIDFLDKMVQYAEQGLSDLEDILEPLAELVVTIAVEHQVLDVIDKYVIQPGLQKDAKSLVKYAVMTMHDFNEFTAWLAKFDGDVSEALKATNQKPIFVNTVRQYLGFPPLPGGNIV